MEVVEPKGRWGTWEELVLGGAVLRHGSQAWDVISSELRARTLHPYIFTPEACKAKYEDLQQQYSGSGCTAWFEELRKKRVAELKRELEKSEESIGSLESKLQSLKAENGDHRHVDYGSSRTHSPASLLKLEGVESSGRDTSKDRLSAGSFTQEIKTNWLPIEVEIKQEISESSEQEKISSINKMAQTLGEQGRTLRKRRGKRKRKDCTGESANLGSTNIVTSSGCKENSASDFGWTIGSSSTNHHKIGAAGVKNDGCIRRSKRKDSTKKPMEVCYRDSENLSSTNIISSSRSKEDFTIEFDQTIRSTGANNPNRDSSGSENIDILAIFGPIAKTQTALVFSHRLDCQKRARYRRIVRQHMDFDTIRSRISSGSISSVKELFRDLLLLANNALAFYSRRTHEYKSALLLRDIITKEYQQHCKGSSNHIATSPVLPMYNPPVKPRSFHPSKRKLLAKAPNAEGIVLLSSPRCEKACNEELNVVGNPEACKKPSTSRDVVASGLGKNCRKPSNAGSCLSLESLTTAKEPLGPVVKVRRRTSDQLPKVPINGGKRGWQR